MDRARWTVALAALLGTLAFAAGCSLLNRPPTASFVVLCNVTEDPLVVDLDASSSSDPDEDTITEYLWTFGDDVDILTPLEHSKSVSVSILRVRYPTEGEYTLLLYVRDERGKTSTTGQTETIVLPNIEVEPTP
jgi:PKD repeat protein